MSSGKILNSFLLMYEGFFLNCEIYGVGIGETFIAWHVLQLCLGLVVDFPCQHLCYCYFNYQDNYFLVLGVLQLSLEPSSDSSLLKQPNPEKPSLKSVTLYVLLVT